ncbi:HupE/UreJ family protein [Aidingimonas lacisalsi]|uniref:HupE/UreJ family protein n=1 Tax=Aidingimonas lacisalsi TaxID=2604086 RepID=UPI0011D2B320|nr:HupE/UreJ family protein [Aidingimonas lacisalsi]
MTVTPIQQPTRIALSLFIPLLALSGLALAHPGHNGAGHGGFAAGVSHPFLGLDHLLAMLTIGLWSVRQGVTFRRWSPAAVLGGMWVGAGLAWGGMALPGVETGIALSVLLAGVLLATLVRLPTAVGGTLVVAFMLFHGHAHGSELPHGASLLTYLVGFSLATLAITYGGKALGAFLMSRGNRWMRAVGVAIAAVGSVFALS